MKKIWFCFVLCLMAFSSKAALRIDVVGAQSNPMPIAVADFVGESVSPGVREVIVSNLERSGLFRVIDKDAYIQKMEGVQSVPNWADWQTINAQALLYGTVERTDDGRYKISFRLWDVFEGQPLLAKSLSLPAQEWRRLGHMVSDMVYSRLTSEDEYFDTRIVYISESGNPLRRQKRLAIMDQDGSGHHYLTDGKVMVLTPRFSPNMQKIAYMSYKGGKPRVYLLDLKTGKEEWLGTFGGMTFAPRFSPDSSKLIFSMAQNGNTEIYEQNLRTKELKRLTNHPAIDTTPSYSPDGKKIVFSSDRSGSQQLYVMDTDGKDVKRISFGSKGAYATPVWSPRGDYIAFTKIQDGAFFIGVMRPDGSGERLLVMDAYMVESPTWSPNGRVLMYSKQMLNEEEGSVGKSGLYSIDVTGYNEQHIPTPNDATDPAWSPLLHSKK